jgi:UDP-glucose 4-epimerase
VKDKKILITGVAGLIGSHLAKELSKDNAVIGIDNFVGGYRDNVPKDIMFIDADCRNINSDIFEGIDIVIHAACTAHEGLSVFSPGFITENTFGASVNVLKSAAQAKVKRFIYFSSMARYGAQDVVPFTESMDPKPQDPYGIAKYAFERVLESIADIHGINYTVVVPHNVIGPSQVYTDPFRNVAAIMINRMLQGKQPIIYGDGMQSRCFSDIRDVVSPTLKIIESNNLHKEVINIGPDDGYITILELAKRIAYLIDFKLDPIFLSERPKEVKYANCSANKARALIGYSPTISIDETLQSLISWIQSRGPADFEYSLPVEITNSFTPVTWTTDLFNK